MAGRNSIKNLKTYLKFLTFLLIVIIFYFLLKSVIINWDSVRTQLKTIDVVYLSLSFLVLLIAQVYVVFLWQNLVNSGKHTLSFKNAVSIFYLSALGRYIPGKVWQLVGLAYLSEGAGIESEVAITASLLSQSLSVITGILISTGILIMYLPLYAVIGLVLMILVFLYPPVFNRLLNWVSLRVRKKSVSLDISIFKEVLLFSGYIVAWLVYGFSFYLLFASINIHISLFKSVEFFSASYLLGLFAVFVPGGLGVREGVLTILLKEIGIASYIASFIALLERICITVTEIILGLFGLLVFLARRKP